MNKIYNKKKSTYLENKVTKMLNAVEIKLETGLSSLFRKKEKQYDKIFGVKYKTKFFLRNKSINEELEKKVDININITRAYLETLKPISKGDLSKSMSNLEDKIKKYEKDTTAAEPIYLKDFTDKISKFLENPKELPHEGVFSDSSKKLVDLLKNLNTFFERKIRHTIKQNNYKDYKDYTDAREELLNPIGKIKIKL